MSLRQEIFDHFEKLSDKVDKVEGGLYKKIDVLQNDISDLKQSFAKIEVRQDTAGANINNLLLFKSEQDKANGKQAGFISAIAIGWGLVLIAVQQLISYVFSNK